jgi:hypothetical protein
MCPVSTGGGGRGRGRRRPAPRAPRPAQRSAPPPHAFPMARLPNCLAAAAARQHARGLMLWRDVWAQHRGALPGEITALEEFQRLAEVPGEREASAGAPTPRHCPHGASRPRSSELSRADGRRAGRRGGALSGARGAGRGALNAAARTGRGVGGDRGIPGDPEARAARAGGEDGAGRARRAGEALAREPRRAGRE